MDALRLSELNDLVRQTLELTFERSFWIVAEIAEIRTATNGHCYLEFVEKDETGRGFVAKARANIWRNVWQSLRPRFERATGQQMQSGMTVLAKAEVTFHPVFGYALNVLDLDPSYTMGDIARQRQEILNRLREDNVVDDNKALVLPRPLQRIAVISSPTAAGYGDFCQQIAQSGFAISLTLFESAMQGTQVEDSILQTLSEIEDRADEFDAVVIIRGGGAATDLQGFESYPLAYRVASFCLPILTGIGHERDETVIDLVAHTRLKTPTAVAAFLIDRMVSEYQIVVEFELRLQHLAEVRLSTARESYNRLAHRYQMAANQFCAKQHHHLQQLNSRATLAVQRQTTSARQLMLTIDNRLRYASATRLEKARHRLELIENTLRMSGPERILALGYSLTMTPDGHVVRRAADVTRGQILTTRLAEGEIQSATL